MLQVTRNRYTRERKVDMEWYKDLIRNWQSGAVMWDEGNDPTTDWPGINKII